MENSALTANLSTAQLALALADLVSELLPGDGAWPSGRDVGVQHALQERFLVTRGEPALHALANILAAAGLPFKGQGANARIEAVSRFEASDPALFGWLRDTAYLAYYETPAVIAVFNAKGTPLEARPHLTGYQLPRFDLAKDTPTHGRGFWIATDDVAPVDISGLDLESRQTEKWGLDR